MCSYLAWGEVVSVVVTILWLFENFLKTITPVAAALCSIVNASCIAASAVCFLLFQELPPYLVASLYCW